MKPLALAFLFAGCLTAGPIYRLSFAGTITTGSASGFNPALSGNSLTQFADLTGLRVSGFFDFDLGLGPAPTISVDGSGFTNTNIQSSTLPVFMSSDLTIAGLTVPTGFFPMPTEFNQPAVPPAPPGSALTVVNSVQSMNTSAQPGQFAQAILAGLNFQTSWSGPRFNVGSLLNFDVLASSLTPFFSIPPPGSFPIFSSALPGQNGIFGFGTLASDATIPTNFGITQWYFVQGNFALDFARGGFVTPEPATLGLAAATLSLLAARARRRR